MVHAKIIQRCKGWELIQLVKIIMIGSNNVGERKVTAKTNNSVSSIKKIL